jgi:hypothetical protein
MKIQLFSGLPKNILSAMIQAVIKWLKKLWFESKTKARLTRIELDNKRDYYWELDKDFEPIYKEYEPVNPEGEAAKLGGAMRLTAKWRKSYETEEELNEAYRQSD